MSISKLKTQVFSQTGEKVKEVELNPAIFDIPVKENVVHQVVTAQLANSRIIIADTKDRSEVRGGGRKPWRQKGTGRARHGSIRSPLWVGGGVTFGPTKERNFKKKINKKMKTKALFMCLSDKVNNNLLILLDKLNLEKGKTKEIVEVIKNLNNKEILKLKEVKKKQKQEKEKEQKDEKNKKDVNKEKDLSVQTGTKEKKFDLKDYKISLLIVLPKLGSSNAEVNKKLVKASKNLPGLKLVTADSLNVLDLLRFEKILILEEGLKVVEKTYLKSNQ